MKLVQRWEYSTRKRQYTVDEAVRTVLTAGAGHEGGVMEDVQHNGNEQAQFIARLVDLLHEKGVLAEDDVVRLLDGGWEKCEPTP